MSTDNHHSGIDSYDAWAHTVKRPRGRPRNPRPDTLDPAGPVPAHHRGRVPPSEGKSSTEPPHEKFPKSFTENAPDTGAAEGEAEMQLMAPRQVFTDATQGRNAVFNDFSKVFGMIGGTQRMAQWADEHPGKFYNLYAKLLPSTSISIGDNSVVQIVHAIPRTELDMHPVDESNPVLPYAGQVASGDPVETEFEDGP